MSISYAAWPTQSNVVTLANTIKNVDSSKVSDDVCNAIIAAVTRKIQQVTRRQFIPSSSETRYFDGSGTGQQVVDEYVTITDVSILGVGVTSPMTLLNYLPRSDNLYPHTLVDIYQGSGAWGYGYYTAFPEGRQNISVTAAWGYGATIPEDLWQAHCEEAACRIVAVLSANLSGRRKQYSVADALSETFDLTLPGEVAGWHDNFLTTLTGGQCGGGYINPKVHSPALRRPVMI